jgi:hypothetical protein
MIQKGVDKLGINGGSGLVIEGGIGTAARHG